MTYTVLGVLYNRFVLQLRGFDQIPQFSVESMNYHGREAWDWIKDLWSTLNIGGPRRNGSYSAMPSGNLPSTNPVSHHSQAVGFGREEDFDGGSNFIRPQPGRNRPDINPISHQSKVNATQSLSFSSPSLPGTPTKPTPQTRSNVPPTLSTISDAHGERDFMLVHDEGAQELGDVNFVNAARTSSVDPSQEASDEGESILTSTDTELNAAATARGRDLGDGDVIRL